MPKKTKSTIKKTLNTDVPFTNEEMNQLINHIAKDALITRAGEYKKTLHFHDLVELSQIRGNILHPRYQEYIEWRTSWNYTKWEKINALRFEELPKPKVKGPVIIHRDIAKEQQEEQEQDERLYEEIERLQSQLKSKKRQNGPLPQFGIT